MARVLKGRVFGRAFGVAALLSVTPVSGQASGKNPAAAQALYEDGRRLVEAGNFNEACPKFEESYGLDPGGGTLLNLADCYEKQGKTALAWSTFKEARVMAQRDGRNERVEFANQHIALLEPRLLRLTVTLSSDARVAGLSVSLNGAALREAAWGVAMPVDPGRHVIRAEAPGKVPFEATLDLATDGSTRSIVVPALADAPGEKPGGHPKESTAALAASSDSHSRLREQPGSRRTIGWVVGGVGLASLGVGSYFGLRAISRWEDRNDACKGGCTAQAKTAGDEANAAATASTIGFGVGLVGVAVGTFLLVSGRAEQVSLSSKLPGVRLTPVLAEDRAGLLVRSTW